MMLRQRPGKENIHSNSSPYNVTLNGDQIPKRRPPDSNSDQLLYSPSQLPYNPFQDHSDSKSSAAFIEVTTAEATTQLHHAMSGESHSLQD
jgi:hypothetical protein